MNELELSNNLYQIEMEINWHKENAGKSIWEIGRRLNHVKENDLVHGEFASWVNNNLKMSHRNANQFMKVARDIPYSQTSANLGVNVLELIASLPEAEKQEQLQKIEQGESPTVRELQDLKKKLKQKEQEIKELKNQPEPEPIIRTVEVEKEIIPPDYEDLKKASRQLERLEQEHKKLLAEREEVDEKSKRYDELNEAILISQGRLNETQKKIVEYNNLHKLIRESNEFLTKASTLIYSDIQGIIQSDSVAKRELQYLTDNLDRFSRDLNKMLQQNTIIEGEIISDRIIN